MPLFTRSEKMFGAVKLIYKGAKERNFQTLSPDEVRKSYKESKHKSMQIGILCDLTCSTRKEMLVFLGIQKESTKVSREAIRREELEAEWKKLYDEGLSDYKIAELTCTTQGMVRHWRTREKLPTNHRPTIPDERWFEVYKMGLSDKESGKLLGVSSGIFCHFRYKNNLKANGTRGGKRR